MKVIFEHTYIKAANNEKTSLHIECWWLLSVSDWDVRVVISIHNWKFDNDLVPDTAATTVNVAATSGTTLAQHKDDQDDNYWQSNADELDD